MKEFKNCVGRYIQNGDRTLYNILINNVSGKCMQADADAINKFFENPDMVKLCINQIDIRSL